MRVMTRVNRIYSNRNWLRVWSHMTSHYTWGSMTALHDFGGVLGRPLDTFFLALTNSWSWLSACVWSAPKWLGIIKSIISEPFNKGHFTDETESLLPLHFKHSHWWKMQSRSKFTSHYAWRTNMVCECKMDVKSTWIPTWHQTDHVSWSLGALFKNRLLEVGLTQNWETMALRTLTIFDLFYYIMCENPHE